MGNHPQENARAYRPDVDGLRAIAILSVVLYHAGVRHVSGGFTGVDIFFVISGYLIGGHIYGDLCNNTFSYRKFYERRAKRILPALYIVLTFILIAAAVLCSPDELMTVAKSAGAATVSLSNFLFWRTTGYFAANSDKNPLLMTWSLGVEEQFYLVIPILMALSFRIRRDLILPIIALVGAASLVLSSHMLRTDPTAAFYLPHSRAWELAIGVGLALFLSHPDRKSGFANATIATNLLGTLGIVLMVAPVFLLSQSTPFPGLFAVPSVLGTALLLGSQNSWINRKVLGQAPFVRIGQVSYSWYLWHWPLLAFFRTVVGKPLPVVWTLLTVVLALGLAILTYHTIEQPFRKMKSADGRTLLRYATVSFALLATAGLIWRIQGWPGRYPALVPLESAIDNFHHSECLLDVKESQLKQILQCDDENIDLPTIAVWGDSHAAALAPGLAHYAQEEGFRVAQFTKVQCPPLIGVARSYKEEPLQAHACIAFNSAVLDHILNSPSIEIAVLTAYWEAPFDPFSSNGKLVTAAISQEIDANPVQSELLESALRLTIQKLQLAGKRVIVVGDVPVFGVDPVWRMTTSSIGIRKDFLSFFASDEFFDPGADQPIDNVIQEQGSRHLVQTVAESIPGVTFWDPRPALCNQEMSCRYRDGSVPLYLDADHLSRQGGLDALRSWKIVSTELLSGTLPPKDAMVGHITP